MTATGNIAETNPTFQEDARQVIAQLRGALASILDALPGHVARGHEVSKALGVHKKLGWQIANLVYEPDLFAAGQHVPGRESLNTFLAAAARQDVSARLIRSAGEAIQAFDTLIEVHAGDRESLEMLLAGHASAAAAKTHLAQRKAWFNSGSFIWGVQARTQLQTFLLHPAARPDWFDLAVVYGFAGFRRVRPNVTWPLAISKRIADDATEVDQPRREPLRLDDGAGADDNLAGLPLLRRFCSTPTPEIRRTTIAGGYQLDEIVAGPTGERGALDCLAGEVHRNCGECYRSAHDWIWGVSKCVRTPSRLLILDQLIHEDVFDSLDLKLHIYRDLDHGGPRPPLPQRRADRIPVFESVEDLGHGLAGLRTPHIQRYVELIREVLASLGWDPTRFHVFRVQIEYPPVPTTIAMETPLPERPERRPEN